MLQNCALPLRKRAFEQVKAVINLSQLNSRENSAQSVRNLHGKFPSRDHAFPSSFVRTQRTDHAEHRRSRTNWLLFTEILKCCVRH